MQAVSLLVLSCDLSEAVQKVWLAAAQFKLFNLF